MGRGPTSARINNNRSRRRGRLDGWRNNGISGRLADYLDVLDAERENLTAETALVQTEYARLNDLVMLFKALGGGRKPTGQGHPIAAQ